MISYLYYFFRIVSRQTVPSKVVRFGDKKSGRQRPDY